MTHARPTVAPSRIALKVAAPPGPLDVEPAVALGREMLATLQIAHIYRREVETCDDAPTWQAHLQLAERVVGTDPLFRDLAAVASRIVELLLGRRVVASETTRLPEVLVRECPECPRMLAETLFTAFSSASHVRWQSAEEMARALAAVLPEPSDVALAGKLDELEEEAFASTQPPPRSADSALTAPAPASVSTAVPAGTTEAARLAEASIAEAMSSPRLPPMNAELLRRLVRGANVRKRVVPTVTTTSSTSYAIASTKDSDTNEDG
jgi:hypothetical protein